VRWAVFGVALVGCYAPHVQSGAPCTPDVDNCPSGQTCQTTAAGSFCTGSALPDGSIDSPIDARPVDNAPGCFGTGLVASLCLSEAPSGTLAITADTTIDTATVGTGSCTTIVAQQTGPSLCVVAADSISIATGVSLRASGPNPLLLVANTTIDIAGELHVDSVRGGAIGAGAQMTCASGNGENGNQGAGGGGGGGSFGAAGADGGRGENSQAGTAMATIAVTSVRGGCAGGKGGTGDGGGGAGAGGAGGGAVYLIAGSITVAGVIDASGAGGFAGTAGVNSSGGGGGGGAGGLIAFDAPTLTASGSIFANGGGGGGGGGNDPGNPGSNGKDPTGYQAGGVGGNGGAGGGGHGGAGFGASAAPQTGGNFGSMFCGGGGGGGGAGIIRVYQASPSALGANVSPPAF
jgi:hypothetical protein